MSSFTDQAETLAGEGRLDEAVGVCVRGLSDTPNHHRGRLLLAKLYYQSGSLPFAIRELEYLARELPTNKAVLSLLEALNPGSKASLGVERGKEDTKTLAEAEFELGELD